MPLWTITLLPVVLIFAYVYWFDRHQKEPAGPLIKAFLLGSVTPFAVVLMLGLMGASLEGPFQMALLGAAMPEEAIKLAVLYWMIWKSPHFDEYFDGIVYAVCVGLGFACTENVFYVLDGGMSTAVARAITAVPAHAGLAVFMGYFLALARFSKEAQGGYLALAFFVPVGLHFVYDYLVLSFLTLQETDSDIAAMLMIAFVVFVLLFYRLAHQRMRQHIARAAPIP
jgi:RsiW-degrading membrane proteinase PrsW (M82 family)